MNTLSRILASMALLVLAACGGGTDRTQAQLRLVNASGGYAELDLREDDRMRQAAVGYGGSAAYAEVDPDLDNLTVHAAGSPSALATLQPRLAKNKHYTLLAFGNAGALRQALLDDNVGAPEAGRVWLRVVNAAPDAGTLDVYLTGAAESLSSSVPAHAAAEYGTVGAAFTVASGTWRLRVAAAGSKSDLRLDIGAVELGSKQVLTLVLTPSRGGVLVNALVLEQQAGIARRDGTQARVRAVAGVADGGAVSATAGGTTLMTGVGSPAVSAYQLVNAGDVVPALAVDGVPFDGPATTLLAGADYTLLVHGTRSAPRADWVGDDNRLPTVAGSARIRLVNGVSGVAGALAMTVDFVPLADGVTAGGASAYASADASSAARVAVTAAGGGQPLFLVTDQRIDASGVYSVFVVGGLGTTTGIVRKDR